jgi:pimeloyl-ACP methyl ester carboxylesterase
MNPKSSYTEVNGVNIHYVEQGTGDLVVLLHGFPDFWYGWRRQIPELSRHFRVAAPDMRGYNLSDKPPRKADYHIRLLAKDVEQFILQSGAKNAVIIGHDWGGIVAWAVASFHPEVVKKLIIINAPNLNEMRRFLREFRLKQIMRSWYVFFFQLPVLPERLVGSKSFFKKEFRRMFVRRFRLSDEEAEQYEKAFAQPGAVKSSINYYRAAFKEVLGSRTEYPKVKAPVMVLWGARDKALGKELTFRNRDYAEQPIETHFDPTSGHFPQVENPEWVNEKILSFIRS